jgi:hypothetical protein
MVNLLVGRCRGLGRGTFFVTTGTLNSVHPHLHRLDMQDIRPDAQEINAIRGTVRTRHEESEYT